MLLENFALKLLLSLLLSTAQEFFAQTIAKQFVTAVLDLHARPQRTAPLSDFGGGRPYLDGFSNFDGFCNYIVLLGKIPGIDSNVSLSFFLKKTLKL